MHSSSGHDSRPLQKLGLFQGNPLIDSKLRIQNKASTPRLLCLRDEKSEEEREREGEWKRELLSLCRPTYPTAPGNSSLHFQSKRRGSLKASFPTKRIGRN